MWIELSKYGELSFFGLMRKSGPTCRIFHTTCRLRIKVLKFFVFKPTDIYIKIFDTNYIEIIRLVR